MQFGLILVTIGGAAATLLAFAVFEAMRSRRIESMGLEALRELVGPGAADATGQSIAGGITEQRRMWMLGTEGGLFTMGVCSIGLLLGRQQEPSQIRPLLVALILLSAASEVALAMTRTRTLRLLSRRMDALRWTDEV